MVGCGRGVGRGDHGAPVEGVFGKVAGHLGQAPVVVSGVAAHEVEGVVHAPGGVLGQDAIGEHGLARPRVYAVEQWGTLAGRCRRGRQTHETGPETAAVLISLEVSGCGCFGGGATVIEPSP
jgi:hypothetical protein